MKSKISYAVLGALQIVLVLALWATNSGGQQSEELKLDLAAPTVFSILESNTVKLPLAAQDVTSFDVHVDSLAAVKNRRVYVVLGQKGETWQPLEVRVHRPSEEVPAVAARVSDVTTLRRVTVSYDRNGEKKEGKWVTALSVGVKPGDRVLVTEEKGKVVYVTPYKAYKNKVYGKVVAVKRSNVRPYAYELTLRFPAGNRSATGSYIWNFYKPADVPQVGSVLNLSFVPEDGGYKVTYVDFNPFWEGKVEAVETGLALKLDYGVDAVRPSSSAISKLSELAEISGRVPLSLKARVARSGQLRPVSLLVGPEEIPLTK